MITLSQSQTDSQFVQNPYAFYQEARSHGTMFHWQEYGMPAALSYALVSMLFKDRRFGREVPTEYAPEIPKHLEPFYSVEAHSMLELEPPRHNRLRSLVLRAFTSRAIADLRPGIEALCHKLIDEFPSEPFDLLDAYCSQVPVITIARLLGVPDEMAPQFLRWSHSMVAMYQAVHTRMQEEAAAQAASEFSNFLTGYIETRRQTPGDDLITRLIEAKESGDRLSTPELIATCILLLNAGHEATVHSLGTGVKTLLENDVDPDWLSPECVEQTVEEILRYEPPVHMFTRWAYENIEVGHHTFRRGDRVALLLGAANRDPSVWENPEQFNPTRPVVTNMSFGGGLHFCVGAPLARLEMEIALPILFERCPRISIASLPVFANCYHFHGLERLIVKV